MEATKKNSFPETKCDLHLLIWHVFLTSAPVVACSDFPLCQCRDLLNDWQHLHTDSLTEDKTNNEKNFAGLASERFVQFVKV